MPLPQTKVISPNRSVPDSDAASFARLTSRRIAQRLLPFLFVLYVIAFLDRMNVGAAALQMPRDLGLSDRSFGVGAGIFFFGYFLLEIPGALIAERWRIGNVVPFFGVLPLPLLAPRRSQLPGVSLSPRGFPHVFLVLPASW